MSAMTVACDLMQEYTPEQADLRKRLLDYEDLYELCMMTTLSTRDQRQLNELHLYLRHKEREYWGDTSDEIVEIIHSHGSIDFPMIRQDLGMLPDQVKKV